MLLMLCCMTALFILVFLFNGYQNGRGHKPAERSAVAVAIGSRHPQYHLQEPEEGVNKSFAYYVLTEKCLPSILLSYGVLGNANRCDVFVNSFKEKCGEQNIPMHITYFFNPNTTWTTGRNFLYEKVRATNQQYSYHIFMDDDLVPIFTEHMIEFRKKFGQGAGGGELMRKYYESKNGVQEAITATKGGNSALREFENDLLIYSPAYSISNFLRRDNGFESRLAMQGFWNEICTKGKAMPWIIPTVYSDDLFIAFHREALPLMLPYSAMFDNVNWWISAVINIFRAKAILYKKGVVNYRIAVINEKHRAYPRGQFPRDLLSQYLAADGKDINGLIDERDLDWKNYDTWEKWLVAFMRNRDLCSAPIKFPVWRHYRLQRD